MRIWTFSILAAFLASLAGSANVDDYLSDDQKILKQLEFHTKYDKIARPPPDYSTTNVVYINFLALKIIEINEVTQSMLLEGFIRMMWKDRRLAWVNQIKQTNSSASNIYLPRSSIWIPDVITSNTMEYNENKYLTLFTVVRADGLVFSSTPFCSRTICDINMQYFPFDVQTCKVIFGSWLMKKEDLELRYLNKTMSDVAFDIDRQFNIESDEYCITKSDFAIAPREKVGRFQEAVFTVSIKRKPLFYVMNLIVPSFLILAICVFSFFLPPESGERLSLNITLMLALTVFLQIVAASTPAQSDNVPILTWFFSAVVVLSAASTIGSMFQIYCHFRGQACQTVDNAVVRLVFLWRLRGGNYRGASAKHKEGTQIETERSEEEKLRASLTKQSACAHAREDDNDACSRRLESQVESEWHTVGRRLDNSLFIVMVIATLALLLFIGFVRDPDYVAC